MKIEFNENEYASHFQLTPETPAEVAQLFRLVNNSKAEKPEIWLSFGPNEKSQIDCVVSIKKLSENSNKIRNSIQNY